MNSTKDTQATQGSGNIFRDLGFPNAEEHLLKARLAMRINKGVRSRGWKQSLAAKELGISQPDVSRLSRGHVEGFSIERLMALLVSLDYSVSIQVAVAGEPPETYQFVPPDGG